MDTFALHWGRGVSVLLWAAVLLSAGCQRSTGEAVLEPVGPNQDAPLDLTETLGESAVRAGIITDERALFGGVAAEGRRGVTAWVERPGDIRVGDSLTLFLPDQRAWAPKG